MKTTYQEARAYAEAAHAGQVRKYSGAPYVTHVVRVAGKAREFGLGLAAEMAALLHDTVEDTSVERGDLLTSFGPVVEAMVWGLTNAEGRGVATPGVDNRAKRKAMDRDWLGTQSSTVRALKLLDLSDNLNDMDRGDSFLDLFLEEAADLRQVLVSAREAREHDGLRQALAEFDVAWGRAHAARQAAQEETA